MMELQEMLRVKDEKVAELKVFFHSYLLMDDPNVQDSSLEGDRSVLETKAESILSVIFFFIGINADDLVILFLQRLKLFLIVYYSF
ncbi:hypothetical protein HZH66_009306 [Vespula vulgaris]|uniref:Uncharacterized protein n=1 Tax=Vespula vulgaris TaxID=7454 RepID=A0A834JSR0_VESVU|nr:hypothetical protein HZH66_009306 [Vespula vulgaris]